MLSYPLCLSGFTVCLSWGDRIKRKGKLLRNSKVSWETKRKSFELYVISVPLYDVFFVCWTISPRTKKRLEATDIWFYRRILSKTCTDRVSRLKETRMKMTLMRRSRKSQLKYFAHIM